MPFHPAAPEDVSGLVDAYGHAVRALIDLGRSLRLEDFDRPTQCPGWTVKDILSHVVGIEDWLAGGEVPRIELPDYDHIRNDVGRFTELAVEFRRGTPGQEVVDELEEVLPRRQAELYSGDLLMDSVIDGPMGPAPVRDVLGTRLLDLWTHEQDIREALDRPGNLDSVAASVAMERFELTIPRVVAKSAGIAPGNTVIFVITGPVMGRVGVRVEDHDGTPVGVPLFSGEAAPLDPEAVAESMTTITMSTYAFGRRAAGRGGLEDVHYTVHGDDDVARRVLLALAVTY